MGFRSFAAFLVVLFSFAVLHADIPTVQGKITDSEGSPLPGVVVSLVSDTPAAAPLSTVTDQEGAYLLNAPAGRYRLTAELQGFQTLERRDVLVGADAVVMNLSLALASFQEAITVSADAPQPLLGDPAPNAAATVTRQVIDNAMLPNSRYDDVLTLMPGVVRGPDSQISIGGARPAEGALFVNSVNLTDPTTGQPGLVVPIESVDSVQVHAGGYPADLGPATGGVTSVRTRSGADRFHTSLDSLFPRPLFENGTVAGVEYWDPNVGMSGPLVKSRVFFEQGVSYRYDQNHFDTLAGTEHNIFKAPTSWSQIDAQVSPAQHVRGSFALSEQDTNHANITAFTPDTSVPAITQNAWSASISDHVTLGQRSNLDISLSTIRTTSTIAPDGIVPYALGHDLLQGSYFDTQRRRAEREEAGFTYTGTLSPQNVIRFGATAGRATLDDQDESAPVSLLRSDGSISRTISFLPAAAGHASTHQESVFVQDTWTPQPWLTLDGGVRYDRIGALASGVASPRVAWTLGRGDGTTNLSGSAGVFSDKVVLTALTFPSLPSRVVSTYDSSGLSLGLPIVYDHTVDDALRTPRATRWDLALDRRFADGWQLHTRYQERHGRDEFVVRPSMLSATTGVLTLASDGTSIARSLETTVGHRSTRSGDELYVSYVRASTRGNLNNLSAIDGLYKEPFVQPDEVGPLPTDVPNRVLAWGLFQIPGHMTIAPFIDVRNGFPYSPIDDDWLFAAARNSARLPWFGSMDLSVTRVVDLPGRLPHARLGLKLYNLVTVHSERDVQRDVASSTFGTRYDPLYRDFAVVCIFLLGSH